MVDEVSERDSGIIGQSIRIRTNGDGEKSAILVERREYDLARGWMIQCSGENLLRFACTRSRKNSKSPWKRDDWVSAPGVT